MFVEEMDFSKKESILKRISFHFQNCLTTKQMFAYFQHFVYSCVWTVY